MQKKITDKTPDKTIDRRTQKTRKALVGALISLMTEKSYEEISIQDILDRADIGRSTFYGHFRDKSELLVEGLQGLKEILRHAQVSAAANSTHSYERVIGFSLAMFEHAQDHKVIYRSLVNGHGWTIVRQHIEEMLVQLMKKEARPLYKGKSGSEIPFDLFIDFLGATFTSVITWWFHYKSPLTPKEINALFRALVIPTLTENLKAG